MANTEIAAREAIDLHMQAVAHRVMDVFENAPDDALAEEIMSDVFSAIGLIQSFTRVELTND